MSEKRKEDHIDLTFKSQTKNADNEFIYEPLLNSHPEESFDISINFLNFKLNAPVWISSMTGGTEKAKLLNTNLATIAGEFGFGMGLGSCRPLLSSKDRFSDFDIKDRMADQPLFINLGIAQIETLLNEKKISKIESLKDTLGADGLIIHVNPLQEWMQPEGDRFNHPPIETIKNVLNNTSLDVMVKEVGQGFGPKSLLSLMELPLAAIDLAGFGGTNFSLLELGRHNAQKFDKDSSLYKIAGVGHSVDQMINWVNPHLAKGVKCDQFILSGGINNLVDGYKYQEKINANSLIGMASGFLRYAHDLSLLREFVHMEIEAYKLAKKMLKGVCENN